MEFIFSVFVPFGYYIVNIVSSSCDVDEMYYSLLVCLCGVGVICYQGTPFSCVDFYWVNMIIFWNLTYHILTENFRFLYWFYQFCDRKIITLWYVTNLVSVLFSNVRFEVIWVEKLLTEICKYECVYVWN
jgi:hypothetical protein